MLYDLHSYTDVADRDDEHRDGEGEDTVEEHVVAEEGGSRRSVRTLEML